eukprot:Gregarina_sp_Poly_1__7506@NODE_418_length_8694_cov_183_956300_g340_i0_p6_GENE_NODE_418_length_8694_cov_183_956300_g340_i0NODE_418_length_8694_cov_183_956300_g340_i0_p6_ORF_typecomplete_len171_score16_96zinc_ribbon_6/PF14599_6/0_033DUF1451/PF07295_11/0_07Fer4_10/PF13237_6/33Fer4_10/PF13237_6/5_1MTHFR_C/PF12225_8/59MTHFR_C/PF12225_8/0_4UPF0515/PF15135_6/0_3Fer4_9/PF13187_6/47_NODE_418_length_8694_cov_183_956300_g340_i075998111
MLPEPVNHFGHEGTGKRKRDRRHAFLPYTPQDTFVRHGAADQWRQALLLQQKLAEVQQSDLRRDQDTWIPQKLVCLKRTKSKGSPTHEASQVVEIHVSPSLNRSPFLAPASRKRKRQAAAVDAMRAFSCQQCGQVVWLKFGDYYESCQECGDCVLIPQSRLGGDGMPPWH